MVKKKGVLCYDRESGRYEIFFGNGSYYGGLHCGDCFDVEIDGSWDASMKCMDRSRSQY